MGYQDYVSDTAWLKEYDRYQDSYKENPRKSDIDLSRVVAGVAGGMGNKPLRVLDIGCSTGNLIRVMRGAMTGKAVSFVGADPAAPSIATAKKDPTLSGVDFHNWDATQLPAGEKFDIIVMSAVAFFFNDDDFSKMLRSVFASLNPGGAFVAWELVSTLPDYRVEMEEHSPFYNGRTHAINIRSLNMIERECAEIGFLGVDLLPFEPPVLQKPDLANYLSSFTADIPGEGRRAIRGCVILPWSFLVVRK